MRSELLSSHEIPQGSLISATLIRLIDESKTPDFMQYVQTVAEHEVITRLNEVGARRRI